MFGEYSFGAATFSDSFSRLAASSGSAQTYETLVVPCTTRTCSTVSGKAGRSDFDVYNLQTVVTQDPIPDIVLTCTTRNCETISGQTFSGDLQIYNLQDALIFNGTPISVIVNCPPGYNCPPGTFPHTFDYPPGTFGVPPVTNTGGFPIVISQAGCQSTVTVVLPAGSSQAAITAAYNNVFQQLAQQQGQCDAIPLAGPPVTPTARITLPAIQQYNCIDGAISISITGTFTPYTPPVTYTLNTALLPPGVSASQDTTTLFLTGTPNTLGDYPFTVTAVAAGASGSRNYTLSIVGITTASPLPNADAPFPYSQTLAQSGITGTVVWTVIAGALPVWASLNPLTGEISGTPTPAEAGDIDNFTVQVTNGLVSCSKEFDIETTFTGGIFYDLVWTSVGVVNVPPGAGTCSAIHNTFIYSGTGPGDFSGGWSATGIGQVSYTGPALNCKISFTSTPIFLATSGANLEVVSSTAGVLLTKSTPDFIGTTTIDFFFTIPVSVAATIKVWSGFPGFPIVGATGNQSGGFTLSVIP
jgi:hypothetical protein